MKTTQIRQTVIALLVFFICSGVPQVTFAEQWHPRNKKMRLQNPGDTMPFKWPAVPRVTAKTALSLYTSGKAFFIHIGADSPDIMGSVHLTENQAWKTKANKLKRVSKKLAIVTY